MNIEKNNGITFEDLMNTGLEFNQEVIMEMGLGLLPNYKLLQLLRMVIDNNPDITYTSLMTAAVKGDAVPKGCTYNNKTYIVTKHSYLTDKFELERVCDTTLRIVFPTPPTKEIKDMIKELSLEVYESWSICTSVFSKSFRTIDNDIAINSSKSTIKDEVAVEFPIKYLQRDSVSGINVTEITY